MLLTSLVLKIWFIWPLIFFRRPIVLCFKAISQCSYRSTYLLLSTVLPLPNPHIPQCIVLRHLRLRWVLKTERRIHFGHFVGACVSMVCWSASDIFRELFTFNTSICRLFFGAEWHIYGVLRSTNVFFKVSRHFYVESEFIVASLSPWRGQSFLS